MTRNRPPDRALWARVCAYLPAVDGLRLHDEGYFFGGVGATINLNFVVGVVDGALFVHAGPRTETDERAGAVGVTIDGQDFPGWLRVPAAAVSADAALSEWVHRGVARARSLARFDRSGWPERISFAYAPPTGYAFGTYEEEDPEVAAARERSIRLAPDYGATLPLWGRALHRLDVDDLDASLLEALRAWQADFDREFHYQRGWSSDVARWRWADAAIDLEERLRLALPPWVELEVNLWPLDR
jgi:hypothetical protein